MPRVVLYSKPDCHLCDIAKSRVERVGERWVFDVEIVDISGDEDLVTRYGETIPVVEVEGEQVCVYRVNERRLARVLEARGAARKAGWRTGWLGNKEKRDE